MEFDDHYLIIINLVNHASQYYLDDDQMEEVMKVETMYLVDVDWMMIEVLFLYQVNDELMVDGVMNLHCVDEDGQVMVEEVMLLQVDEDGQVMEAIEDGVMFLDVDVDEDGSMMKVQMTPLHFMKIDGQAMEQSYPLTLYHVAVDYAKLFNELLADVHSAFLFSNVHHPPSNFLMDYVIVIFFTLPQVVYFFLYLHQMMIVDDKDVEKQQKQKDLHHVHDLIQGLVDDHEKFMQFVSVIVRRLNVLNFIIMIFQVSLILHHLGHPKYHYLQDSLNFMDLLIHMQQLVDQTLSTTFAVPY